MITKLMITALFGFLSCVAVANDDAASDGFSEATDGALLMAGNQSRERRDDRQGDRQENRDGKQDCRQEEGRVGNDKRECKQEERGEGDDDKDDKDKGDEKDDAADA
jgi:hypothetical protein